MAAKTKAEYMKRGQEIIDPKLIGRWEECVDIRMGDLYQGWDLDAALDIIERLNNGASLEEARRMLDEQGHSGSSFAITISIILTIKCQ